jgi:hypothetical protein
MLWTVVSVLRGRGGGLEAPHGGLMCSMHMHTYT